MDWILGMLPLLLFAACLLMMTACYVGMRRSGHAAEPAQSVSNVTTPTRNVPPAQQIAALQMQLSQLQIEQLAIARQLDEFAESETALTAIGYPAGIAVPVGLPR